ncbi:MAG TPA: CHRD domain-containing protein, partial [Dehalococcoidia bacterium]
NLSLVPFTQISGTVTLSDADVADLKAGNLYFNAHSKEFPGGLARFQLVLPAAPAAAASPATGIAAPSTGDAGLLSHRDADSGAWVPFAALIAAGLTGVGTLALARRRK